MKNRRGRREHDIQFLGVVLVLALLTTYTQNDSSERYLKDIAKDRAEILGYQVIQIFQNRLKYRGHRITEEAPLGTKMGGPEKFGSQFRSPASVQTSLASLKTQESEQGAETKPDSPASESGIESAILIEDSIGGLLKDGFIGSDPWGHPFQFQIQVQDNHMVQVLIWSRGPGTESSTSVVELRQKYGILLEIPYEKIQ